jgi:tRNA threonylcarbamoyladenosine biosynthesis protein TsaE
MEPYRVGTRSVFHLDLYRLSDPGELEYLGVRDLLGQGAVLLVEWPERGLGELPGADLRVHIDYLESGRRLTFEACTPLGGDVLAGLAG